jgi:hypothetical protein
MDERNDNDEPDQTQNAELKALFEQAVRAIGFYEAQRKEVLIALENGRLTPAGRSHRRRSDNAGPQ